MKKGDRVSALDEDLKGVVVSVLGEQVVIEDEYGFNYSFHRSKLVPQNHLLYNETPIVKKEKETKKTSQKHHKNELKLDLHFDQLVKFPNQYNTWERNQIQKEKLIETLDYCKENSIKKLLIIHGLGDGILQEMVYDVLRGYAYIDFDENEFFKHFSTSIEVRF